MMRRTSLLLIFVLFLFAGCGKEGVYVPNVYVNYQISVQAFRINATNGILLVPNYGVAGLMIVAPITGGYMAFDRCSSVNPENLCKVAPDEGGITATDPCTGAKFSLIDGSPQKAPAVRNLKSYQVSVQNNTTIIISN
jgi:nitrite reductase/ring-hydroxylating ferredoxin subunit